jgi:hypothetical protein
MHKEITEVTCFSNKDKKEYSPKYLWYACYKCKEELKGCTFVDSCSLITPDGDPDEDGGKEEPDNTYFHVEIF